MAPAKAASKAKVTVERVLKEYARIGFADLAQAYGADGISALSQYRTSLRRCRKRRIWLISRVECSQAVDPQLLLAFAVEPPSSNDD